MPEHAMRDDRDPFLSPKRGSTEVYLIRHADALPDADEVVLDGVYDNQALSALGRRQARALAGRMREVAPAAIYSSPIARARQTAAPTAQILGLEVHVTAELREIEVGPIGPALPGDATPEQVSQTVRARLHAIAAIALTDGIWSAIPGSEPSAALRARAMAAIDAIAAGHAGQRVAVVSHGGLINACIAALLGIERDYFFPCANTSVSIVRIKGERRMLLGLNDIAHLRQADAMP